MHHKPLGGVEGDAVSEVDTHQPLPELRADERRSGIGRVTVQPEARFLANGPQLLDIVERTGPSCPQSSA